MLIVGLTGGVGSGKTIVSQTLREEGAYLIDADQIARELVTPHSPTWNELVQVFGKGILKEDKSLDRKRLAQRVFSNPKERTLLNQVIHPRIKEEINRRKEEILQKDPEAIIIIDAALLVELGEHREMDKVIVVVAPDDQRIERLKRRDGMSEEEAQKVISSQMPQEEKMKVADFVIRNEGTLEETKQRARELFQELKRIGLGP